MERAPRLLSRFVQFPAGGSAQLLDRVLGLFAKLRCRFHDCPWCSQDVPPESGNSFRVHAATGSEEARLTPLRPRRGPVGSPSGEVLNQQVGQSLPGPIGCDLPGRSPSRPRDGCQACARFGSCPGRAAGGREPKALLVRQFPLGRRRVRLQHRRWLEPATLAATLHTAHVSVRPLTSTIWEVDPRCRELWASSNSRTFTCSLCTLRQERYAR
jgi:hypothetical protein